MSSVSQRNKLLRAAKIIKFGEPSPIHCDRCFEGGILCVIMAGETHCAECARRGKPCVSTSWAALDKAKDELSKEISEAELQRDALFTQLSELQARIDRKKKVRGQAEERSREKMACLIREAEASGELSNFLLEDIGDMERDLGLNGVQTPFVWSDPAPGTLSEAGGSSSGS
jgi:hypothetical protein